jgi:putative ABC transport system permease protein
VLLSTLFQIEGAAIAALLLVGLAALAVTVIVFALSFKMRRKEFATLEDIGVGRGTLRLVKLFEMALIMIAGTEIAVLLVWLVSLASPSLITWGLM